MHLHRLIFPTKSIKVSSHLCMCSFIHTVQKKCRKLKLATGKLKHNIYKDFYLFSESALPIYLKMYNWVVGTYSGWLSICKSSIDSSTVLGVIRKNGAWQGNYVNRLFDLKWRSCWFLLFCGLLDGYYVAPLLVQTSQVLLAFMCFDWLWLHLLLHSMLRIRCVGRRGRSFDFHRCFSKMKPWRLWYLKYFRTSTFTNCFCAVRFSSPWEFL